MTDPPPSAPDEDPEVDKPCPYGRGPDKLYPDPLWKSGYNYRLQRSILTTGQYPVTCNPARSIQYLMFSPVSEITFLKKNESIKKRGIGF